MSQAPAWFERKFEFTFPVDLAPNLLARAFDVNGMGINRVWVADISVPQQAA